MQGEYNLAGEILIHAQQRFPSPLEHCKMWMITKYYVTFYEVLYQGLWSQAKTLADSMATVRPTYSQLLYVYILCNT